MRLYMMAVLAILTSSAGITLADDKDTAFKPEQLVGAWKLVSGERQGTAMDKTSTGGIFVFTKDTLIGKNDLGEELSWMSYTLDTKQTPVAMNLTITKNFVGVTSEAIVEIREGQLRLCYNLDKKGRPKAFATKEAGNNDRLMVFVKSVDPAALRKEGKAALPDLPKPIDREAVLAKLKANKVSLLSLKIEPKGGGPLIALGTGLDGGEANNATDENLRLVAQLPEVEQVMVYKGKVTADGLAALAALPKLRSLQMYATDVPASAFAVLPKLTQLKSLSLGSYPVTDEVIGYAGQIKGLKTFDHTQSAMTPAGFLKFLNGVDSLEQLTLFGDYVDDACMQRIGQMKDLKRFWTDSKRVTSAGWVHLAGLTKMQDLLLSSTNFGDNDTRALGDLKNLKSLILNKTQITDAGMPSLAGLTKLHDLGLEGTKVTDKGMAVLKAMTELDNLYVGMTEVTVKGLAAVPKKERMQMMRVGKGAMTAKQLDEMMEMYPKTQIFDPSGYWTPERVKAAMKELGKDAPGWKKDADSIEGRKVEAASQKRWQAIRHQDVAAYNTVVFDAEFNRTGPDAKRRNYSAVVFETLNDPKKKLDAVTVSDQAIVVLGDQTAIETGRAVGSKKDLKEPVWDVLYTATWVRKDGKWWIVNEHQTPAK